MRPIDQFINSVQESFAENRSTNWGRLGLSILVLVGVSVAISAWLRRLRRRRDHAARIQAVLSRAGLSTDDFGDLTRIAAAGEVPVLEVMTRLAPFEHATAKWLADEAATIRPAPNSRFERVRRLRRALGFSPLSAHLWLLSTRELAAGDSISTNGVHGHVVEVNEASFAFEWPVTAALAEGAAVGITIERPDDARYLARVQVLQSEAMPAVATASGARAPGQRVFFSHDENPERQQDREFSRLRIDVPIKIQVVDAAEPVTGKIVDVSAGGLSLSLPVSPAGFVLRGSHVRCWFMLDEQASFESLIAVVVDARTIAVPRSQNLRLAFTALPDADRDRLVAAVARHQRMTPVSASGRA